MANNAVLIDTVTDVDDDAVAVLFWNNLVILRSVERGTGHVQEVFLDRDLRDRFAKAWAEAVDRAAMPGQEDVEPPRDESDCRCGPNSERCPCEADGDDGLCSCCRNGDCNGRDAMPGQVTQ